MRSGYRSRQYASALAEFGVPLYMRNPDTYVLYRSIPCASYYDVMGLYPLMVCDKWRNIANSLSAMSMMRKFVSFVAVTDPFCNVEPDDLVSYGFDFARVYKQHVVVNLDDLSVSDHHAYYASKALNSVEVQVLKGIGKANGYLNDWCDLYAGLVERHNIRGISKFSRRSFETQFVVPGIVVFRGIADGETVGMHLWYQHDNVAYSHLAASSEVGYNLMVSYALHQHAIDFFKGRVDHLDLGAGAGVTSESNGLAWFKKGWSTSTLPVYLCGKVLRPDVYGELTKDIADDTHFFPAYRDRDARG